MKRVFLVSLFLLCSVPTIGSANPVTHQSDETTPAPVRIALQAGVGLGTAVASTLVWIPAILFQDDAVTYAAFGLSAFGLTFGTPLAIYGMGDSFNAQGKWWTTTVGYLSGAGGVLLTYAGLRALDITNEFSLGWSFATVGVGVATGIVGYEVSRHIERRSPSSANVSFAPATDGKRFGMQLQMTY